MRKTSEIRRLLEDIVALDVHGDNHAALPEAMQAFQKRAYRCLNPKRGNPRLIDQRRERAAAERAATDARVKPIIAELRAKGLGRPAIAKELNRRKITAPRGGQWLPGSVYAIERRSQ